MTRSCSFRITPSQFVRTLGLICAAFWLALAPASGVTLAGGDLLVSDEGTTAANSGIVRVPPATGTRTFVTGNGVGGGAALDVPRLVVAGTNGMIYYWESFAPATLHHIIALNPATGTRTALPGGAYATARSMCWDPTTNTLLVGDVGTTQANAGIVRIHPGTGARTFVTGNGVGGGALIDVPRYVTCAADGTIFYLETSSPAATFRQIVSVNPATGQRTLVPGGAFPTVNVSDLDWAGALAWDPSTSTLLVIDEGTAATNSGIVRVNVNTGARSFVTGNGVGGGAAIDVPRFLAVSSTGAIYYQERVAAATSRRIISVNPANGQRTEVPGGAYTTLNGLAVVPVPPPSVTSSLSASGTYGTAIATYTITGTHSPTSFSAVGLPGGLSLDSVNGQITGTPTTSGVFNVTIGVQNASGSATATLVFTIARRALTVSGVMAGNKIYDRSTAATLNLASAALVNVVAGDSVSLNTAAAVGAFADANVGVSKPVQVSGLSLSGSAAGHYTLTQPVVTASITPRTLSVEGQVASLFVATKIYDGTAVAQMNLGAASLSGVLAGDSVFLVTSGATAAFADKSWGAMKTITASGFAITGAQAGNYLLVQPSTVGSISRRPLSLSGVVVATRTYDGSTSATADFSAAALGNIVSGDAVYLLTGSASAAFLDANAGTGKTVMLSGLVVTGADGANYSLFAPAASGTILPAPLTVAAISQTRPYGANNPALGFTLAGFVAGETAASALTGAPALATAAVESSLPGDYPISIAKGTLTAINGNYAFVFAPGSLTVRKLGIEDWRAEFFSAAELLDPTLSGPMADADGDGAPNLLEFAFGGDPRDPATGALGLVHEGSATGPAALVAPGLPVLIEEDGAWHVLFVRRASVFTEGLVYRPRFSPDLAAWTDAAAEPVVIASEGLLELVSLPFPATTGGEPRRFFRVEVESAE